MNAVRGAAQASSGARPTGRGGSVVRYLARVLALVGVLFVALGLGGCATSFAGTDDVAMVYETDDAPSADVPSTDLRALVLQRLSARGIGADVRARRRHLRITVARDLADDADELVTWSGTLHLASADDAYELSPHDLGGLVERVQTSPDGHVDRYWQGPRAEVARAVRTWATDAEHRLVGEPLWETARGAEPPAWRTRVVRAPFAAELADGTLVSTSHGSVRLRGAPGTAAARTVDVARSLPHPVLVRGRTSLGGFRADGDALVVDFGRGIEAYGRAEAEKRLLVSPRLPTVVRTRSEELAPNAKLVAACFVVPLLLSLAWLVFVRRFDRAHPEPAWLVVVTFLLGALATIPAGALELAFTRLSPWLDPRVVTLGGEPFALPLSLLVLTLVVGVSEEGAKRLATVYAARRPEFDEPVDGILYGMVASLGFAAAENVHYFAAGRLNAPLVIARCFMSIPAHLFFGAIWGYGLGLRLVDPKARAGAYFLAAAAAHGLFDALLAVRGAGLAAVVLNVVLASTFVALVRRALRHGIVDDAAKAVRPEHRKLFRVGRPKSFLLSAVVFHAVALGIFVLGAWYQLARRRPELEFVLGSSALLVLLGAAAYAISATLPLDVVVDDHGVTFAGAARPWRTIRGVSTEGPHVVLDCEGGPVLLGPATEGTRTRLVAALRSYLGGVG